jgi:hypothetical protein
VWILNFLKGFLAGRFRNRGRKPNSIFNQNNLHNCRGGADYSDSVRLNRNAVHEHDELYEGHLKLRLLKRLKSERGEGELLAALIVILVLTFMLIQPIDTSVYQNKNNAARMILNKYMNKMRLDGYLTSTNEAGIIQDFNNIGCPISDPATDIDASAKESRGDARVLRSIDPSASALSLKIICTPAPQPFKMMSLIGGTQTPTQIKVGRVDQSERVDP